MVGSIALCRPGISKDVANGVLFLCSEEASYITGESLHIDGGKFLVQNQEDM